MRRTGIDLSATHCVVVDAEMSNRWRKHGETASLRVHNFSSFTHADSADALTAELKPLAERKGFPRRAWVNLWDVQSSHQYLLLPSTHHGELEAMARHHGASVLGRADDEVTVSTSIGSTREERGRQKTELSFFAAGSEEVRQRLRPILDAGFAVEGVTTPCGALWSLAKMRRSALPGEVHAFVALGVSMSALAIFSKGFLLYARDLNWGYAPNIGIPTPLEREDLAGRLSAELRRSFLYLKQYWEDDVSQVLLCGEMPEIRSLTAPLIERLNVEVETLDTLEGIDATALPDRFAEFAEQAAAFRLACAIAAAPPPANLLPLEFTAQRVNRTGRRLLALGSAAAVGVAAFLWGQASVVVIEAERQIPVVQQELAALRPRVESISTARQDSGVESQQRAVLEALDSQGPRIARLLEALSTAVPPSVTIKSVRAVPAGDSWRLAIEALARGPDRARARIAADTFVQALRDSPLFGVPLRTPARRITAESGDIELTADYLVRK